MSVAELNKTIAKIEENEKLIKEMIDAVNSGLDKDIRTEAFRAIRSAIYYGVMLKYDYKQMTGEDHTPSL